MSDLSGLNTKIQITPEIQKSIEMQKKNIALMEQIIANAKEQGQVTNEAEIIMKKAKKIVADTEDMFK